MDLKLQPQNIKFQNVSYTVTRVKAKKTILKGVSGEFKSGELTAIMGPSGAGKSTLLNILTGFIQNGVGGSIHMNDVKLGSQKYAKKCSYILQDDNLYPNFTVHETMILAANLKIADMSVDEKNLIIDNVLNTLQLIRSKYTKCGSLSGGQRKRLSIALELLDNRQVLFLDEPTSGLDSSSSAYCVQLLHNLSREGRTIICTIHQPSAAIYEMFDQVYVLAQGQCVYRGAAQNTLAYLSENGLQCPMYHSLADFLIEVANGDYGEFVPQLAISANRSMCYQIEKTDYDADDQDTPVIKVDTLGCADMPLLKKQYSMDGKEVIKPPSEWSKFWTLVGRSQVYYYRDWTVTHLKLVLHILCATLIGLLYGDSGSNASKSIENVGFLLIGVAYLWYTTVMPGVLKFPTELEIVRKETFNNWYKVRTYFLANTLTTTPIHIVFATIYSTIIFYLTDQPWELNRYTRFTLVYVLLTIVADALGLLLGAIANPINGTFWAAIITAFKLAFCGFLALWSHMIPAMKVFTYVSTHAYGLEALVLSVYDHNREDISCPEDILYCHYKNPKMIIRELGMNASNYEMDVSMIFVHLVLFKVLAYFMLKRRLKNI
ncbi:ATP-binding cassette sub-family G member 1 [Contarinia nasturtii]|uniref:ATP-binding cassette sub-family G member 1 n=1 Tax=Contarinia nasturtii TaxID=265458 RepID=UPI0012D3F724|nr:ATP-binding cassette sub-family G member 1 [Contarinia nasturtii]